MKTSELTGAALDWAVARCEGGVGDNQLIGAWYAPSTDWSQGGPIIEREKISTTCYGQWLAALPVDTTGEARGYYGPTPLIAAMRCYVASKMGDEVEVPDELQ
jgi:hypothetical protein